MTTDARQASLVGWTHLWLPLGILTIWFIYRVARGWRRLAAGLPMP